METHNEMECSCVNECVCVCVSMCVFNQYVSFSVSINCIFDDTPTPTPFYCVQSLSLFPKSLHNSDSITQDYAHTHTDTHAYTQEKAPWLHHQHTLSIFSLVPWTAAMLLCAQRGDSNCRHMMHEGCPRMCAVCVLLFCTASVRVLSVSISGCPWTAIQIEKDGNGQSFYTLRASFSKAENVWMGRSF